MQTFTEDEIRAKVARFLRLNPTTGAQDVPRTPGRELSFDFAYNYFTDQPKPTRSMELSCLQLGFYLASWGMLRASSYLFRNTNLRHYQEAVRVIEDAEPLMRRIDANRYSEPDVAAQLVETCARLRSALVPARVTHVTLVTKVMLGVWGVTPAFDRYMRLAASRIWPDRRRGDGSRFDTFTTETVNRLSDFDEAHAPVIDALHSEIRTVRFDTGTPSEHLLTRAKVIDMFMFQLGYDG